MAIPTASASAEPITWALAFMLLYWGRPVGRGLIYLELVLMTSVWPSLPRWGRLLLLAAVVALMASHWWALVLTARGEGMPLSWAMCTFLKRRK